MLLYGLQTFVLTFLTAIVASLHAINARVSAPTPGVVVIIAIVFEVILAIFWFVYIKNHVIGWQGPGTFLNQLDEMHSHMFVRSVWPTLVHRTKREFWSGGGNARVCSSLVFARTTGWFRRPRVWSVSEQGSRVVKGTWFWVVRADSSGVWATIRDEQGGQARVTLEEALRIVSGSGDPLMALFHQEQDLLAECKSTLAASEQKVVQSQNRHDGLGQQLVALATAARMERRARPSPQARWMRGSLQQLLRDNWAGDDLSRWGDEAEHAHLSARTLIAEAVAQAEQCRTEESAASNA